MTRRLIQRARPHFDRRDVLRRLFWSASGIASASVLAACEDSQLSEVPTAPSPTPASPSPAPGPAPSPTPASPSPSPAPMSRFANLGPLQAADANGLMLPAGFTSRVVAVSGQPPVLGGTHLWHTFPDGGATYKTADGGWVYTSNSEIPQAGDLGGCGALKFSANGTLVGSYSILTGTTGNCAGGKTPWGTWISCEEVADGQAWECNPRQAGQGVARPAMGMFAREAVAVDPVKKVIYQTEDNGSGRFYRFVPTLADWPANAARPMLQAGKLQVLRYKDLAMNVVPNAAFGVESPHPVIWEDAVSPNMPQAAVRSGLGAMAPGTPFNGGEGLWYYDGLVYFSSKGDNRIWCLDTETDMLECIYDFNTAAPANKILSGVDNLTLTEFGDVLVAEDGGDMDLCVILPDRNLVRLLKASDASGESELVGPAFSPDGTRLYFSAQRNGRNGAPGNGITFEVTMPFSVCPSGDCTFG